MRTRSGFKWIIVVVSLAVAVLTAKVLKDRIGRPKDPAQQLKDYVDRMSRQDHELLENPKAQDHQIHGALIRLSRMRDSQAREVALKRVSDPSKVVREAVADALGFYTDPESLSAVKLLIKDPEKNVRVRAIEALGFISSEERRGIIQSVLAEKFLSEEERNAAYSALIQVSQTTEQKKPAIDYLVKLALKSDDRGSTDAAIRVVSYAPRDPSVHEMLRKKLESEKNPVILPLAIRHLAAFKDSFTKSRLVRLSKSSSPDVRLSTVQTLHLLCPSERYDILSQLIKTESNRVVLNAALRESEFLGGKLSKEFVEKTLSQGGLSDENSRLLRESLRVLEANNAPADICALQQKKQ